MLTELRIKNFAIIESLTLPLARGFNVLSGETGAGKSIIVGALGLLLGERANADVIRTGADRATVEGVFDVSDRPEIRAMLDERGIDVEDATVVLKREVAAGRARAWINGTTVNAGLLADVGRQLANLHGQHEAQTLLDPEAQRRILDAFAGATEQATSMRHAHGDLSSIIREISDLTKRRADAERRADYLRHVAKEIGDAQLTDGEDVKLEEEARRLENAEELRALASGLAGSWVRSLATSRVSNASTRRSRDCRSPMTARTTRSRHWPASSRTMRHRSISIRRGSMMCVDVEISCSN
jgi:DNA repair protein RecN (Recombination protein N)